MATLNQVKDAIELRGIILNHMDVELEWTREYNPLGETVFTSRDDEYQLTVARGNAESYWSLGQFTDADVDGVAVGRYRSFAEGENFDELLEALAAGPWACPQCGERIGEPVTIHSREFQGDEAHGGVIEACEEACTICQYEAKLNDCEYLTRADVARMMDEYRLDVQAHRGARR